MSIDYSAERWERVKAANRLFWRGELDRPLIHITVGGRDPGWPEPQLKPGRWHFADVCRDEVPVSEIIDRWDYDMARHYFCGDALMDLLRHVREVSDGVRVNMGYDANTSVDSLSPMPGTVFTLY